MQEGHLCRGPRTVGVDAFQVGPPPSFDLFFDGLGLAVGSRHDLIALGERFFLELARFVFCSLAHCVRPFPGLLENALNALTKCVKGGMLGRSLLALEDGDPAVKFPQLPDSGGELALCL